MVYAFLFILFFSNKIMTFPINGLIIKTKGYTTGKAEQRDDGVQNRRPSIPKVQNQHASKNGTHKLFWLGPLDNTFKKNTPGVIFNSAEGINNLSW